MDGTTLRQDTTSIFWRKIMSRGSVRQASAKRTLRKDHLRSLLEGTCMLPNPAALRIAACGRRERVGVRCRAREFSVSAVLAVGYRIASAWSGTRTELVVMCFGRP